MVFRTLLRLTGSREHVDDLAQEVFLRLYRALPSFRGESLITTYLYRDCGQRRPGRVEAPPPRRSLPRLPLRRGLPLGKTASRIPAPTPSSSLRNASFNTPSKSSFSVSARSNEPSSSSIIRKNAPTSRSPHVLSLPIGTVRTPPPPRTQKTSRSHPAAASNQRKESAMHNQPLNRQPLPQSANDSSNASNSTHSLDWRLTRGPRERAPRRRFPPTSPLASPPTCRRGLQPRFPPLTTVALLC